MKESSWELADAVALALVGRDTDVNEVQKVVTHVRVQAERNPERVGDDFFALLETMLRDGRYLVRSGRTLDYYRNLSDICRTHLRGFRHTTPESGWELVGILGWVARLMRYYRSPEGKSELASKQRGAVRADSASNAAASDVAVSAQSSQGRDAREAQPQRPTRTPPQAPPKARPREEKRREAVTLLSAVKLGKARVRTAQDEEVMCTGMSSYPPASPGQTCYADVTRQDGRALKAIFKGWAS